MAETSELLTRYTNAAGSNPAAPTIGFIAQLVEQKILTLKVAGSMPVKSTMKTVIHCWQQKAKDMPSNENENFWGIGDLLRGTLALHRACKDLGYRFFVDTHKHPVGNFLLNSYCMYFILLDSLGDNVKFLSAQNDAKDFIKESVENPIVLLTNAVTSEILSEDERKFMKTVLTPTKELEKEVLEKVEILPIGFGVRHFRLGDSEIVSGRAREDMFGFFLNEIGRDYKDTDILFSDSAGFKKFVSQRHPIKIIDNGPLCHLGVEDDLDLVKSTLMDLFVLSRASYIKREGGYHSGFATWTARIFDIPLFP